ncbi:MAG: adenylate/guanylate cyclase domain-containing protein [Deltaproteobacteria bacterium]|nr:adenylate/guanylate cyclase domain-containing protein [Deltaproteobacteria bacterium]
MSDTATLARIHLEQREEDERTIAELALHGERAACAARMAMMFALGIAAVTAPLFGETVITDAVQVVAIAVYVTFTGFFWLALRRAKPSIRGGLLWPFAFMAVDFAFVTVLAWRAARGTAFAAPLVPAVMLALYVTFNVARHSRWHAVVSSLGAIAACYGSLWLYEVLSVRLAVMLGGVYLVIGALIVWVNTRVRATWVDVRRREHLARFLPRQVVARVLSGGGQALLPVQREVTVLFGDIRDFTAMSEHLPPHEVLEFLDDYFGHMSQIVKGHDGMLNKFIGDGLLAVWSVPDAQEHHATLAIRAALDMLKSVAELNAHRRQTGKAEIRIGIGIHSGVVAAGMLGGADQHEYTVIGDAVNLASRIEGLTKAHATDLLVSERTWTLSGGRFQGRRVAEEKVKGRREPVVVYAVTAPHDSARPLG